MKISDIKKQYPTPKGAGAASISGGDYCVGGALCQMLGRNETFPCSEELAAALREVNECLDPKTAECFAEDIIDQNDGENFRGAWSSMRQALTWKGVAKK